MYNIHMIYKTSILILCYIKLRQKIMKKVLMISTRINLSIRVKFEL